MSSKVVRRYSQALFDASVESKILNKVADDAEGIIRLIESDRTFRLYLQSPVIKIYKKKSIAEAIFEKKVNKMTLNFIRMLIGRNREYLLPVILKDFLSRKDNYEGTIRPLYTGTYQLDKSEKQKLKNVLDKYTGLKCQPEFSVDEGLIGGSTIQIKDTIIDGSIKRKLETLRDKLKSKS